MTRILILSCVVRRWTIRDVIYELTWLLQHSSLKYLLADWLTVIKMVC